jgi:proteasome assembly chaperone (PAC2) family protein
MPFKIHRKPMLKNPRLVSAWGSIGDMEVRAGIEAVTCLKDRLRARLFGEIEPDNFFDLSIAVENGLVGEPEFPQNRFYSWENADGDDLILFIADREPPRRRYEYANLLLQVAEQFQVSRIYTVCAFPSLVSHTAEPRVLGVANDGELVPYLERYAITILRERSLFSMNGILLSLARKRGVEGIYLLGEVPSYAAEMSNPKACLAVLRVLTAMLGISIDLADFDQLIEQAEAEMDERVKEASRAFLEDFTIDYRDLFPREDD